MSQDAALRFSVEESVWFQKGQEVFELLSISLDPNIVIEEHDQYVSIRGALQLTGEYRAVLNPDQEEKDFEFSAARFVNEVVVREDGTNEIHHRFPVDITIPRNRIDRLEEVFVSIDSFDYDLPEAKCLKLYADLSITGIAENSREHEEADIQEIHEVEQEAESVEFQEAEALSREDASDAEPIEEHDQAYQEIYAFRGEDQAVMEHEADPSVSSRDEESDYPEIEVEVRRQTHDYQEIQPLFEEEGEQVQQAEHRPEMKEAREAADPKSENSLLLTKLFGREEDEELARLKICIVQQGDTIAGICEKYECSAQQLIRVNHLPEDKEVFEGQTLYIPQYAGSK
ncbi:stage VI sporulation protein D [Metabacillus sp. 84]|uniref:stage VI sporulation protein D n=1 Tax=Metabacillus sp. 84 TaxID=3404705 RepID=UPI003CE832DC